MAICSQWTADDNLRGRSSIGLEYQTVDLVVGGSSPLGLAI